MQGREGLTYFVGFEDAKMEMLMLVRGFTVNKEKAESVLFHGIAITSVWIAQSPNYVGIAHVDDNSMDWIDAESSSLW
jgi:hypothetical protein